jgi:hypothetical protein
MVVYSVFKSLGLKTEILPLLDVSPLDEMDENEYEREEEYHNIYLDELDESDEDCPVCGYCDSPFPSFQEWKATRPKYDRVGTKFHGLKLAECDEEAEWSQAEKEEVSSTSSNHNIPTLVGPVTTCANHCSYPGRYGR